MKQFQKFVVSVLLPLTAFARELSPQPEDVTFQRTLNAASLEERLLVTAYLDHFKKTGTAKTGSEKINRAFTCLDTASKLLPETSGITVFNHETEALMSVTTSGPSLLMVIKSGDAYVPVNNQPLLSTTSQYRILEQPMNLEKRVDLESVEYDIRLKFPNLEDFPLNASFVVTRRIDSKKITPEDLVRGRLGYNVSQTKILENETVVPLKLASESEFDSVVRIKVNALINRFEPKPRIYDNDREAQNRLVMQLNRDCLGILTTDELAVADSRLKLVNEQQFVVGGKIPTTFSNGVAEPDRAIASPKRR